LAEPPASRHHSRRSFSDNAFFLGDQLSGLIDFYFACNDALAYDVAIAPECLVLRERPRVQHDQGPGAAEGLSERRALEPSERDALPLAGTRGRLRFLLTRAYDWLHTDADALVSRKDPQEYLRRLKFHRSIRSATEYGLEGAP
jgi:homoserine kinase type II